MTEVKNRSSGAQESTINSPDRLANMLVISFRISQGDEKQQKRVQRYAKGRHPDLRIGDTHTFLAINSKAKELIYSMFFPAGAPSDRYAPIEPTSYHTNKKQNSDRSDILLTKKSIDFETLSSLEDMQEIFNGEPEDPRTLIPDITAELIEKDYKHLVDPGEGRPKGSKPDVERSFYTDPWGSFLIHFVMRGHKTGVSEFNELFADVKSYLDAQRRERTEAWTEAIEPKLIKIIESHNEHHPDDQFEGFEPILSSVNN